MRTDFDLAIVGSGFAGSLLAMIARRIGLSVVLIERGSHPRIVIGESTTPLTNLLFEELAERYDLPFLKPLAKWGSWQTAYPEVACGKKRGFTFYQHDPEAPASLTSDRARQLLVAASPHDSIADTHWYRADLDRFLMERACGLGVEYLDRVDLQAPEFSAGSIGLRGVRRGRELNLRARMLVDATGPRGYLHCALSLAERDLPDYPKTQALYAHFWDVDRLDAHACYDEDPPYPIDDAAVHHLFPGGWIWVLQFNNGITSAGVAWTDCAASRWGTWERLLKQMPEVKTQFEGARTLEGFRVIPRLPYRAPRAAGPGWAMLPSAYGFVDPLFSTGFPLTLLGVHRLATILETGQDFDGSYSQETDNDLLAAARLVSAVYANLANFRAFTAIAKLYFAAVSFSEVTRRLGKPQLAPGFLLRDHPVFGPQSMRLLERAHAGFNDESLSRFEEDVNDLIEPFDAAGLTDSTRRNWFPVLREDLLGAAAKLQSSPAEIEQLLARSGFVAPACDIICSTPTTPGDRIA